MLVPGRAALQASSNGRPTCWRATAARNSCVLLPRTGLPGAVACRGGPTAGRRPENRPSAIADSAHVTISLGVASTCPNHQSTAGKPGRAPPTRPSTRPSTPAATAFGFSDSATPSDRAALLPVTIRTTSIQKHPADCIKVGPSLTPPPQSFGRAESFPAATCEDSIGVARLQATALPFTITLKTVQHHFKLMTT